MSDLLSRTRWVVMAPSLPENVGAIARSMAHFGLSRLVVVGGVDPLHPQAVATAAGADAILAAAARPETLAEAIHGCGFVVGTTARVWTGPGRSTIATGEAASLAAAHAPAGDVAVVFGTEKHGLSTADLLLCHQVTTIPGVPGACLNLAQAATILARDWYQAATPSGAPVTAVAAGLGEADLAGRLADLLAVHGLVQAKDRERKVHTLRRVLSRAQLDPHEAVMLAGWLAALGAKSPPRSR